MGCLYQYKQETQHFPCNFFLFPPYQDPLIQGCVCVCVCLHLLKTKKFYSTNTHTKKNAIKNYISLFLKF